MLPVLGAVSSSAQSGGDGVEGHDLEAFASGGVAGDGGHGADRDVRIGEAGGEERPLEFVGEGVGVERVVGEDVDVDASSGLVRTSGWTSAPG